MKVYYEYYSSFYVAAFVVGVGWYYFESMLPYEQMHQELCGLYGGNLDFVEINDDDYERMYDEGFFEGYGDKNSSSLVTVSPAGTE